MFSTIDSHNPRYFIIIVHFGPIGPTKRLLAQISSSFPQAAKIIVIDHAAVPYPKYVEKNLLFIRPQANAGYAAGINCGLGILASQGAKAGDIVIIMNNDLEIESGTLPEIKAWWERRLKNFPHINTPADLPAVLEGLPAVLAGAKAGRVNYLTGRARSISGRNTNGTGSYLDGSLLTAPYELLLRLRGLPEEYFLYWEDVALSFRARTRGVSLAVIPGLALKNPGDSVPPQGSKLYYLVRNGALWLERSAPLPVRLWWYPLNRLRLLYHHLRPSTSQTKIIRQALSDAINNRAGPRP